MAVAPEYSLQYARDMGWGSVTNQLDGGRVELLPRFAVGRCLDVGCAAGGYTAFLSGRIGPSVGLDGCPELAQSGRRAHAGIPFLAGDALRLPFRAGSFDTVVLMDILEHVEEDLATLAEAARVARQRVILTVPLETDEGLRRSGLVYLQYMDRTHLRYYTIERVARLMERAGLRPLDVRPMGRIDGISILQGFLHEGSFSWWAVRVARKIGLLRARELYSECFAVGAK